MPHIPPKQLTPTERIAAEQARDVLRHIVTSLPRGSSLWPSFHGALCTAERALDEPVTVAGRKERRRGRE